MTIAVDEKKFSAEEAHEFIRSLETDDLGLVPCPCRTRTEKMGGRECSEKFPIGSCIFIGGTARRFEKMGLAKMVTKEEAITYLDEMVKHGLIPTAQNAFNGPFSTMCLCCGCCCSNVRGRTVWDNPTAVLPSSFAPQASEDCTMCETCVDRCMLGALSMDEDQGRAVVDVDKCVGCGVCVVTCPTEALKLYRVDRPGVPFDNMIELMMTMAKENDRL